MRLALSLAIVTLSSLTTPAQQGLDELLARMSMWLEEYEAQLSQVVADERLEQRFTPQLRGRLPYSRTLVSTFSFMPLPGGRAWLGLRETRTVNGRDVRIKGPGLLDLLKKPDETLPVELAWRNAQHNIGTPRTTNVPTLILELMHPKNRSRFTFASLARERVRRLATERVRFTETQRPSLIRSPDGKTDLLTSGEIWVESSAGRIHRALVRVTDAERRQVEWMLTTEFRHDAALDMLLPFELTEEFPMPSGRGDSHATYRNFRRFTTSARVVP